MSQHQHPAPEVGGRQSALPLHHPSRNLGGPDLGTAVRNNEPSSGLVQSKGPSDHQTACQGGLIILHYGVGGILSQARVAVSVLVMERGLGHVARGKEKTFPAGTVPS